MSPSRRLARRVRARSGLGRAGALATGLLLGAGAACDSGPRGPGTLEGTLVALEPLGAATLEVSGRGVLGFEGAGGTEAYGALISGSQGRHRVVLVNPTGDGLDFVIRMEDVGAEPPTVTVLAAAGVDNVERSPGELEIRLGR